MDVAKEKRRQLQKLFPEVFFEGQIDFNHLKRVVGEWVQPDHKSFGFHWSGKADCMRVIQSPAKGTLKPCREESLAWDTTQNLFIEGDNLEVLKLLQRPYFGKVKMIYIDPPYNTGKDFVYPDKYSYGLNNYLELTEQRDGNGCCFSTNVETDGRFHSKWLNMMYPRLHLARTLLREDGVIFISIDDSEQANLKKLCDEIFGEENFVGNFVWKTKRGAQGMPTQNRLVPNHEYILIYGKDQEKFQFLGLDRNEEDFSNPDNDIRGPWKRQYLQRNGQNLPIRYIRNPKAEDEWRIETPYTQEKIDQWIKDDCIIFPKSKNRNGEQIYPARKEFLKEYKNKKQLITTIGLYPTKSSTEALYNLFDGKKIFSNPKPLGLLKYIFQATVSHDDIVLDFFAGSATTAHAVMQLNAEDGGNRKFVCVQLPEPCDKKSEAFKAGFKNIAEIGKERIRRAIKQIKQGQLQSKPFDSGFRSFKLDKSCFKEWDDSPTKDVQKLLIRLNEYIEDLDPNASDEDILYEIVLKEGLSPATTIEKIAILDKVIYSLENGKVLACLDRRVTEEFVLRLTDQIKKVLPVPHTVIFLDAGFDSDVIKTNTEHAFKVKSSHIEKHIHFYTI